MCARQVLTPTFDPTFSADSYGFRPGKSAHQAVERAPEHIAAGHRWVVDLDLAQFFDRVNHDVLMARVARRVGDKRVLRLIRRNLQAGAMEGGLWCRSGRRARPRAGRCRSCSPTSCSTSWTRSWSVGGIA